MSIRQAGAPAILLAACLLLASCSGNDPGKALASAKDYLKKNDTRSATIQVKNALQVNPDLGEARFLLGSILLKERNATAAEIELRKALAAKYPPQLVIPELALALLNMGQAQKVVDEFGKTQLADPSADASLQTTLAAAYGVLGAPESAAAALTAALKADPGHAPALLLRARQEGAHKDYDSALSTVDQVLAKDARNAEAWKLKGDLLQFKARPDDALAAYRKSIEASPDFYPGHSALIALLLQLGKPDEASKQLAELKRVAPGSPHTNYLEAQLAFEKQDFKLAKDLSQQLALANPSPRNLELAGMVELQLNVLDEAEAHLAAAVRAQPELRLARRLLVKTYLRSGQPAKAIGALTTGKEGEPIDPSLYTVAGQAYLQNGDAKRAEEYFAKASQLDPANATKQTALALSRLAAGETVSAFDELQNIAGSDAGISADLALISAHMRRNEFDQALAAEAKLEAKQPGTPLAPYLRGRIQLAQKDSAGARKSFEQALKIDPSYFAAAASLAVLDMADKKPDDARRRFESLLASNPKNGAALLALAELAVARGAPREEVAKLLDKAIEANPSEVPPRLMLINLHLGAQDAKQAVTVAESAVNAVPNSPELLDALGRAQLQAGDVNQALATFTKLADMKPLLADPQLRLAAAHMTNKDPASAEQSMRKALALKPDDLQVQRGLIFVLLEQKKVAEAMAMARGVQKARPKEAAGFVLEGDIDVAQRNWDAAAAAYRSGLRLQPSTEIAVKFYSMLATAGKADEADRFTATWMSEHPKDAALLMYRGDFALSRKDMAAAEKNYLAVLKIQPDAAAALNNLAWLTHQARKPGALAYAERANAVAPDEPAFMDTWAMLLADKGDYAKAIELQRKAVERQPTNGTFRLNLAKFYIAAGDKARAKTELDSLARLGDKDPSSQEASALLKTL